MLTATARRRTPAHPWPLVTAHLQARDAERHPEDSHMDVPTAHGARYQARVLLEEPLRGFPGGQWD